MNPDKLKEKIIKLNSQYRKGKPKVSDAEYDAVLSELETLIPEDEFEDFKKILIEAPGNIKHKYVVGSLNKLKYGESDTSKWIEKYDFYSIVVSDKIDGCSFVATYENGKLISGATRGDGYLGSEITNKLRDILPSTINYSQKVILRGELTLEGDDHIKFGFKNRRNGVVGIINSDFPDSEKLQSVKYYVHQILNFDDMIMENQFHWLDREKLSRVFYQVFRVDENIEERLKIHIEHRRIKSPYDMDGLVLTGPNCMNEHMFYPEKKIAFKVNSEGISAEVQGIEWKTSRSGWLKPVVIINPTEIDGTTVTRVSAYNAKYIVDEKLSAGAIVKIIKSGDIIPKIISVVKPAVASLPTKCPSCGNSTAWDGVELKCSNEDCVASSVKKVNYFIRQCGIDGISETTLENLDIKTFEDLLEFVPNDKYKIQTSLYKQIQDKIFTLEKIDLHSKLPFNGAAETTIDKMVEFYGFDEINSLLFAKQMPKEFPDGIGQVTLAKLRDSWIENVRIMDLFVTDSRFNVEKIVFEKPAASDKTLIGKTFLITGTLSKPRKHFEQLIISSSGTIASSVNKKLDFLIVGDSPGSKLDKAKEFGIVILKEDELVKLLGSEN